MRIKQFNALAYGEFTEKAVHFGDDAKVQIVLGANEAGKSTLLRAMRCGLFGISAQCSDGFKHKNQKVGAVLKLRSGEEVSFTRSKGKNAVRRMDGTTVAEDEFAGWLGGVSDDMFDSLFGLDHRKLIAGGRQLVSGQGDVALLLFESAGFLHVQTVLKELEEEAEVIFAPSAHKRELNAVLKEIKELEREIRSRSLRPEEYGAQRKALLKVTQSITEIRKQKEAHTTASLRLQRLHENSCDLTERMELQERVTDLGPLPELPADFKEKRVEVFTQRGSTRTEITAITAHLDEKNKSLDKVPASTSLLQHQVRVEVLKRGLDKYRDELDARIKQQTRRDRSKGEAEGTWRGLMPDQPLENVGRYTWLAATNRHFSTLLEGSATSRAERDRLCKTLANISRDLNQAREKVAGIATPADCTTLLSTIEAVEATANQKRWEELEKEAREAKTASSRAVASVPWWNESAHQLAQVVPPIEETLRSYETPWMELATQIRTLGSKLQEIEREKQRVIRDIEGIELRGKVPTDERLYEERTARDLGWQLIRRVAFENELTIEEAAGQFEPPAPLDEAYERHVRTADELADALRADADRVVEFRTKQKRVRELVEDCKRIETEIEATKKKQFDLSTRWTAEWSGIDGVQVLRPPVEMRGWISKREVALKAEDESVNKQSALEEQRRKVDSARERLASALTDVGNIADPRDDLVTLSQRARIFVESCRKMGAAREQALQAVSSLVRRLEEAQQEQKENEQSFRDWSVQWNVALGSVGLDETSEQEVKALLAGVPHVRKAFDEWQDAERRLLGIQQRIVEYERAVQVAADEFAPELSGLPSDITVERLATQLDGQVEAERQRQSLNGEIESLQTRLAREQKKLEVIEQSIKKLLARAGGVNEDDLPTVEGKVDKRKDGLSRINQIEMTIKKRNPGSDLGQIESEAMAVTPDALSAALVQAANQIKEADANIEAYVEERTKLSSALEIMETSGGTSELYQNLHLRLAKTRELAERYAVLRLQAEVLKEALERYRQSNERPTLQRAGEIFSNLTGGRFTSVQPEFDGDSKIIHALRADGVQLGVEALSDGTADQLFLSLRLAAIESHVEQNEEFPCVFDDILINFDEERTGATLKELAGLSEKTQVLLFTHHNHLVSIAEEVIGGRFQLHSLDARAAAAVVGKK